MKSVSFVALLFAFSVASVLLFACGDEGGRAVGKAHSGSTQAADAAVAPSVSRRQALLNELGRFKAALSSKDKERIADFFSFPLTNATVYADDSAFNARYEAADQRLSREEFLRSFPVVSEGLGLAGLSRLFQTLPLDSLRYTDSLHRDVVNPAEPCYSYYTIEATDSTVRLTVGSGFNQGYKSSAPPNNDVPENDSSMCEHVLWWTFRFDGQRLKLESVTGAG